MAQSTTTPFNGQLGATLVPGGVQFAAHAADPTTAQLLLFAGSDDTEPERVLDLEASQHRTGSIWHITVPGVGHGQIYNWRIGTPDPTVPVRALLDPYGLAVTGYQNYHRSSACPANSTDNTACALRSVVVDLAQFDWQDDAPPPPPSGREFIYETHVGAFTAHPASGVAAAKRGTYAGLAARLDHLVALGVTAVELLPVHAYDPQDAPSERINYWGYSTVSYFAPHPGYATSTAATDALDEFRSMVRALHQAGLRVILDVVYNHTAEAGPHGPVLSWRGFDDAAYYLQDAQGNYLDYTGCGNTLNANGAIGARLIADSLRHWVSAMHVDGFRFDLAAAMARGHDGTPLTRPPVLWAIDTDPVLAGTRLIAEAWDVGGLQLVGGFPGQRFATWNGHYRDTVRRFLKGDSGLIEDLMARIVGSPDIFNGPDQRSTDGINFVTCHDGFTLRDLVSYEHKANYENGENNQDGSNDNLSWNSGVEGPTNDSALTALRERRLRNFLTLLFFSHGTPMILAGDEWGQSRQGNNNPWCLDNERNWLDWRLATEHAGLLRFVRLLAHRANHTRLLARDRFWTATSPGHEGDITWHGRQPHCPDWSETSHHLAYELIPPTGDERVLVLLNAGSTPATFALVAPPADTAWCLAVDTAATSPHDIMKEPSPPAPARDEITLSAHAIAVFIALP